MLFISKFIQKINIKFYNEKIYKKLEFRILNKI